MLLCIACINTYYYRVIFFQCRNLGNTGMYENKCSWELI